jgi:hypothetical protein
MKKGMAVTLCILGFLALLAAVAVPGLFAT